MQFSEIISRPISRRSIKRIEQIETAIIVGKICFEVFIKKLHIHTRKKKQAVYDCMWLIVFIRLNVAAFIKFLAFPMRPVIKGRVYSRVAFISKSLF